MLHALELDPVAMLPFCFQADFEGDQWTFLKPSLDDLWTLYGLEVQELNVWDRLPAHLRDQVAQGRIPLVEVDSYYLPDSTGTAYGSRHVKTTIAVNALDLEIKSLSYFHNGGYYALGGDDLRGVLGLGDGAEGLPLAPYTEIVKLGRLTRLPPAALLDASLALARRHLERRPPRNPLARFRDHLAAAGRAPAEALDHYHRYAFATVRQLGAGFQMAAAYVRWVDAQCPLGLTAAAAAFDGISEAAKALLFKMARAANAHRPLQYEGCLDQMEADWQTGFDVLGVRLAES